MTEGGKESKERKSHQMHSRLSFFEQIRQSREAWKYLIELKQISQASSGHLWFLGEGGGGRGGGPDDIRSIRAQETELKRYIDSGLFDECCRLYCGYWFEHCCGLQVWDAAKLSLVHHGYEFLTACALRPKLSINVTDLVVAFSHMWSVHLNRLGILCT